MKLTITLVLVGVVYLMWHSQYATSSSLSPPPSRTGAPGETTCAVGCHTGNLNTGNGLIDFSLEGIDYVSDSVYNIELSISDSSKSRFGFELTALDSNNTKAGSFIKGTNSSIRNFNGREYISHQNAGTRSNWQFSWLSPSSNMGDVTFYLAANAANNNGNTSGDNIYTRTYTVTNNAVSVNQVDLLRSHIQVYPNPFYSNLNVRFNTNLFDEVSILLLDGQGDFIFNLLNNSNISGQNTLNFNVSPSLPSGIYFLQIDLKNDQILKKIVKL